MRSSSLSWPASCSGSAQSKGGSVDEDFDGALSALRLAGSFMVKDPCAVASDEAFAAVLTITVQPKARDLRSLSVLRNALIRLVSPDFLDPVVSAAIPPVEL